MKPISALVSVSHLIGLAAAQAGLDWSMNGVPDTGLTDITFPMNIKDAPHVSGYYFAMQMSIINNSDVIYTGLQPRPDSSEGTIIHGTFSSFIKGSTTSDDRCHGGADGSADGVSCAYEFVGSYANTWNVVVENPGNTTWIGSAVDTVTGQSERIGSFHLPEGTHGVAAGQFGFVEYYPWNSHIGEWTCANVTPTSVTFYPPVTQSGIDGETTGALDGYIKKECYGYGEAVHDNATGTQVITLW